MSRPIQYIGRCRTTPAVTARQPATKATRWRRSARTARDGKGESFQREDIEATAAQGAVPGSGGSGSTTASKRAWPRKRARRCAQRRRREPVVREARQEAADRDPPFEPRQAMPAHVWMPEPKATCRFGVRAMSSRSGSANCSGSRLAAPMHERHRACRGASATPPISVALRRDPVAELVRALEAQEFLDGGCDQRRARRAAARFSSGHSSSACERRCRSGWSSSRGRR